MKNQYIGVTGFMSRDQVEQVLSQLPQGFNKRLMVGMLVSDKTIQGLQNKFPLRYPKPEAIETIFTDDPRVLNLIHYNTKKEFSSDIAQEMCLIESIAGNNAHGFQLNMVWPIPRTIVMWRNRRLNQHNEGVIVLQCGAKAMAQYGNDPKKIAEKLKNYDGLIDYVLLDPSGGTGKAFDLGHILSCLDVLYSSSLEMNFGVAGGLAPSTLPTLLAPLAKAFPQVSIDAEGKLRTPQDHLDVPVAVRYIAESHKMLK